MKDFILDEVMEQNFSRDGLEIAFATTLTMLATKSMSDDMFKTLSTKPGIQVFIRAMKSLDDGDAL